LSLRSKPLATFLSNPHPSAFIGGKVLLFRSRRFRAITAITAILFHGPLTKPLRFPHLRETLPLHFPACVSHNIQ
jgi:hypothetical protein